MKYYIGVLLSSLVFSTTAFCEQYEYFLAPKGITVYEGGGVSFALTEPKNSTTVNVLFCAVMNAGSSAVAPTYVSGLRRLDPGILTGKAIDQTLTFQGADPRQKYASCMSIALQMINTTAARTGTVIVRGTTVSSAVVGEKVPGDFVAYGVTDPAKFSKDAVVFSPDSYIPEYVTHKNCEIYISRKDPAKASSAETGFLDVLSKKGYVVQDPSGNYHTVKNDEVYGIYGKGFLMVGTEVRTATTQKDIGSISFGVVIKPTLFMGGQEPEIRASVSGVLHPIQFADQLFLALAEAVPPCQIAHE